MISPRPEPSNRAMECLSFVVQPYKCTHVMASFFHGSPISSTLQVGGEEGRTVLDDTMSKKIIIVIFMIKKNYIL